MAAVLHVASFAGGIVVEGSPDAQSTNEVLSADSVDIGSRGALVVASEPTDYLVLNDSAANPWLQLWALLESAGFNFSKVMAVGEGADGSLAYVLTSFNREGEATPFAFAGVGNSFGGESGTDHPGQNTFRIANGVNALGSDFAGVFPARFCTPGGPAVGIPTTPIRIYIINIGAREGTAPNLAPGLYIGYILPPFTRVQLKQIAIFDSLGTGSGGLLTVPPTYRGGENAANGGTHGRQLYFRGIVSYNNHVFGWGYDASDEKISLITNISNANPAAVTTAAPHGYASGDSVTIRAAAGGFAVLNGNTYGIIVTGANSYTLNGVDSSAFGVFTGTPVATVGAGDGPNRVMFCNLGNPLKWGNDNVSPSGTDRLFTDSDAIILGDSGELVRGAITFGGKLIFGTNKGLHYIAGYGRDSFLTDGATPIMRSYNVVGPKAMIEGPDKALYGVCDQGLWVMPALNSDPKPIFRQLCDFKGRSNGYWDQIWTDYSRGSTYPGTTNQDLVWMAIDWDAQQVIVGIPWCSIANGYGYGTDTVILKYHVQSGGYTRQQFTGVQYTAAGYFRSLTGQAAMKMLGTATAAKSTIQRYAYKATKNDAAALPTRLPAIEFGPYAPWGADGTGVTRRVYLTLAWDRLGSYDNVQTPIQISNITQANPAVVTTAANHNLKTGQIVDISGSGLFSLGMTQVLGGPYVITVLTPTTFSLNGVDSRTYSAYNVFGVVSFPLAFDLTLIPDASPFSSRTVRLSLRHVPPASPNNYDLWVDTSETDQNIGNSGASTIFFGTAGFLLKTRKNNQYVNITGATKANPCVITAVNHRFRTGDRVSIQDVLGMTQLNNDNTNSKDYTIVVIDADHFSIGVDSSAFGVYTSGGTAALAWLLVPGMGGEGYRAMIPIPVEREQGTRFTLQLATVAGLMSKRWQVEGFGLLPGSGDASST